jgi:hypothetical protein
LLNWAPKAAGSTVKGTASDYRKKAAEMREKAKTAQDPVVHKELLSLAEQYDRLAKRTESGKKERQ